MLVLLNFHAGFPKNSPCLLLAQTQAWCSEHQLPEQRYLQLWYLGAAGQFGRLSWMTQPPGAQIFDLPRETEITLKKHKGLCLVMWKLCIEGAYKKKKKMNQSKKERGKIGSKEENKVHFSEKTTKKKAMFRDKLSFCLCCKGTKNVSMFWWTQEQMHPVWIILLFS